MKGRTEKDHHESYAQSLSVDGSATTDAAEEYLTVNDNARLAQLGYKAEFRREFSMLETVAFAFTIMAVIPGISTTFTISLPSGGHVGLVWGWFIPCFFVMCVAASMAELVSSMPTSAGLYYFAAKLAPEKYSALAGWITGWANITGQVTLMTGIDYTLAQIITTAIAVGTDGAVNLGAGPTYGILLALLFMHGCICSAATQVLARLNLFYALVIIGTTVAAILALPIAAGENRVSTREAFTSFENHTGWTNNIWAFMLSFTVPMWTFTGYDSAAHISEETSGAAKAAPIAILISVASVSSLGWLLCIAASYAIVSVPDLLETELSQPMGQLYLDVVGKRGMLAIWCMTGVVQFLCGAAQGVDASRVIFAFARDNALPGSRWWKRINPHTQTPVNAVWLVMALAAVCGLLGFSSTALTSLAGASVIGMYISYATPIFLRITSGRHKLARGPFSLGILYMPIGAVAVAWVAFIVVLLCFPMSGIVGEQTMNYTVVIIMAVFLFAGGSWIISARKWFVGPLPNVDGDSALSSYNAK
ncbi:amino acid transporter [Daedalea quercina L-15889]|uniref:Amino acid transporter n=1 Tax=Daedalea quercina L-15889 TaxID=1314783 RepID=A0A165QJS1_9APHY|nr:amino acid transporter [Daedalea quercina L-15889]